MSVGRWVANRWTVAPAYRAPVTTSVPIAPSRPLPLLSLSTVAPVGSSMLQNATVRVAVACAGVVATAIPAAASTAVTPSRPTVRRQRRPVPDRM